MSPCSIAGAAARGLGVLIACAVTHADAAGHPWLPPFGLDRVGQIDGSDLQADAIAHADKLINPVDLGTVLVPHGWLLIANGETALVDVALFSKSRAIQNANLRARFDGDSSIQTQLNLEAGKRITRQLRVPAKTTADRSILHVSLSSDGKELWKKDIYTMVVNSPPRVPTFGALETQLRYDANISVQDRQTKKYSSIPYARGWDEKLNDVVVFLPNGARFVFWRGSSYIPFWAGLYNTGLTYQWAETIPPKGFAVPVDTHHFWTKAQL